MVKVVMFGVGSTTICRGCQAGNTLGELAEALGVKLKLLFGPKVDFEFVDVSSHSEEHRQEIESIKENEAQLPLTLVDGEAVYPGMFSPTMIIYAIRNRLREKGEG